MAQYRVMDKNAALWAVGGLIVGLAIGYWFERRRCQQGKTP